MDDDKNKHIICLTKNPYYNLGFGFSLIGGKNTIIPHIICDILPSTPAAQENSLQVGDVIEAVNTQCLDDFTTRDAFELITKLGDKIVLQIRKDPEILKIVKPYLTCDRDSPILREVYSPIEYSRPLDVKRYPHQLENMDVLQKPLSEANSTTSTQSPNKGFDYFLMTGDKIIRTTPTKNIVTPPKPKRENGHSIMPFSVVNSPSMKNKTNESSFRHEKLKAPLAESGRFIMQPEDVLPTILDSEEDGNENININRNHEPDCKISEQNQSLNSLNRSANLKDSGLEMNCSSDRIPDKNASSFRGSKSHENYLQGSSATTVDIDVDDIAYSVDVLNTEQVISQKIHMPTFLGSEEPRVISKKKNRQELESSNNRDLENVLTEFDNLKDKIDEELSIPRALKNSSKIDRKLNEGIEMEDESLYHQPVKEVDRPSAYRLAKRLYTLDGFKKTDISRHLSKKNEFSQFVGEEFLKYFNFEGDNLVDAFRKFIAHIVLNGETSERERVLMHFAQRYVQCNPTSFNSDDSCHTLTCAILLLNTDLHNKKIDEDRKMTCKQFIENLRGLNENENFPKEILLQVYNSIKAEALVCDLELDGDDFEVNPKTVIIENPVESQGNLEKKKAFVMRKCCCSANGRKMPFGKRRWKMFFVLLDGSALYLYKNEDGYRLQGSSNNPDHIMKIYHSFAEIATDYKKKEHVFRLTISDGSIFLFQASNSKDRNDWISSINKTAAFLSAQPLPPPCGSQKRFQRYVMPSSCTKLPPQQQLISHQDHLNKIKKLLSEHSRNAPDKSSKKSLIEEHKIIDGYLRLEEKRFSTYSRILEDYLVLNIPGSLAETIIGEVEEPPLSPTENVDRNSSKAKNIYTNKLERYHRLCDSDKNSVA